MSVRLSRWGNASGGPRPFSLRVGGRVASGLPKRNVSLTDDYMIRCEIHTPLRDAP